MFTFVAVVIVFCAVQDRLTARGVSEYVLRQRAAIAAGGPTVSIDAVMTPAVSRSVRDALLSAALVAGIGVVIASVAVRGGRVD